MTGSVGSALELRRVRAGKPEHAARKFYDCDLHPEADAEIRDAVLARVSDGGDLALDTALAEAAGHQDRIHAGEARGAGAFQVGRLDVVNLDAGPRS